MTTTTRTEEYIENKAAEMGLKAHVTINGDVCVASPFGGHWFIKNEGSKYRLEHENYHLGKKVRRGTYHKHQTIYPDIINAMMYILVHDKKMVTRGF